LEEPHPKSLEAVAVAVLVDVVGFAGTSFHAFDEPQPSKFDVKLITGDFVALGAGAAGCWAGAG
jgi:hypothetical protein